MKEDRHKTTFAMEWGLFRYPRVPQGYLSSGDILMTSWILALESLMKVTPKRLLMKSSSGLTTYNRPSSESAPSSPTAIRMEWSSHLKSLSSQRRRWSSRGSRSPGRGSSRLTSTWRVQAYQPSCLKFRQDRTHGSIPSPPQPVHTLPVER